MRVFTPVTRPSSSAKPCDPARATGEQDLVDRQGALLALIRLQRRDELAAERLEPLGHSVTRNWTRAHRFRRLRGWREAERGQQLFRIRPRDREPPLELRNEDGATPLEDAREVADLAVGDRERRSLMTDRRAR